MNPTPAWVTELPELQRDVDLRLDEIADLICEAVPIGIQQTFRRAGVRIGHA